METSDLLPSLSVCPSLGMKDDPRTSFRYPTLGNYCCYCRPSATPHLQHQSTYCFGSAYHVCPVHQQPAGRPLPRQLRANVHPARRPVKRLVILCIGILLLVVAGWVVLSSGARAPLHNTGAAAGDGGAAFHTATVAATETPLPPSETAIPPTRTPVQQNTLLPTSIPVPAHVLEIPFRVSEYRFVIHQVREGENFEVLEASYGTTTDAIMALNHSLSSPLWVNRVILISPGLQSVDPNLPAFQTYEVDNDETTLDELAHMFDADVDLLKYYNNCQNGCQLAVGDWLIVPHLER